MYLCGKLPYVSYILCPLNVALKFKGAKIKSQRNQFLQSWVCLPYNFEVWNIIVYLNYKEIIQLGSTTKFHAYIS